MHFHSSSSPRTPPSPPTDTELISDLKAGKHSALSILYDRYGKFVYRLALHILKNSQEAEDLTQEIFLALWRSNTYNPARGSLGNFLTTMTRSRAIDKLRSRGRNLKFLDSWRQNLPAEISYDSPFEHVALGERSQQLQNALSQLSPDQRQVLEMAYYQGLSLSEISQQLDIPLGTVKTRSRLGLSKLRQILEDFIK
ncbi:MAG TPA: RNA polymerase subunit sigma [Cyanobacteria bacterium UBA8543]|nr:RNA polymerase subunit sigma [Cyanobacteria bacterium UBA8543]